MATSRLSPSETSNRNAPLGPVALSGPLMRIGKYDVQSEIGQGREIKVYRAFDRGLGRPVTLKLLTAQAEEALCERFRSEVAIAGKLKSESFIAIYDLGEHAGRPFAAMHVMGGDHLGQAIRTQRPLTLLDRLLILWQVTEGANTAHRGGLSHLGLRPSAVALHDPMRATIQDFGIVRLWPEADDEWLMYAAPETRTGANVADSLCDVFSFGTIAYELLSGSHPFSSVPPGTVIEPLSRLMPQCPEPLERIVHRALEGNRDVRYQSMAEIQEDLEPIVGELKHKRCASLLADSSQLLSTGELDQVQPLLREVLQLEPDNRKAFRLRSKVRDLQQARELERKQRLDAQLQNAATLLDRKEFNNAIILLADLSREYRGNTQVDGLLEAAYEMRLRSEAIVAAVATCDTLLRDGRVDEALELLHSALVTYPQEPLLNECLEEAEMQKRELEHLAETRKILDEAQWLLDQDRVDLAVQFLREKAGASHRPDLAVRLAEIEAILPPWEKARFIRETQVRLGALYESEQWSVALTVLEEALQHYPDAPELLEGEEQLRSKLASEQRRQRLARRLDSIRQKVNAEAWPQARMLIEAAQTEFAGEPELESLRMMAENARRRSEADHVASLVRQCLEEGEPDRAEDVLRKGLECLSADPLLETLQKEVVAARHFREEWRRAQILFGKRKFLEAEQILVRLQPQNRTEVDLLLDKVREGRAATEEDHFYHSGRGKALKLIEQQQYDQAADLLRNLLGLFPGDPILLRDLQSVQAEVSKAGPPPSPAAPPPAASLSDSPRSSPPAGAAREVVLLQTPSSRNRRLTIMGACAAFLAIAGGGAAGWKLSKKTGSSPPPNTQAASGTPAVANTPAAPALEPPVASTIVVVPAQKAAAPPPPVTRRPFSAPPPASILANGTPQASLTAPLAVNPGRGPLPALPQTISQPEVLSPPRPASAPAEQPAPAQQPAPIPIGGRAEVARLISGPLPAVPPLAQQIKVRGTVVIEAVVDTKGMLTNIKVVSGHPILAGAARDAVQKWRYQPATLNGVPVESKVDIKMSFTDR